MERYSSGISFCAVSLMIKWSLLNKLLIDLNIESGSEVNLFINFESVIKNLCKIKKFNTLMSLYTQKVVIEFESAVLNLVAHYRGFFKKAGIKCNIYFFYTNLDCNNSQLMKTELKFYRNYYYNKYKQNPEFKNIFRLLQIAVPDLKLITNFIEGVYFIETNEIDSSLVPKILSKEKSILLTEDIFDTVYCFETFKVLYIKREFGQKNEVVFSYPLEIINKILNCKDGFEFSPLSSELYYKLLLAFKGSPIRNIQPLSSENCSLVDFALQLKDKIIKGEILEDFKAIGSVLEFIPKRVRNELEKSYKLFDLKVHLSKINELLISKIKDQIVDNFDFNSIMALNNERFLEFPVNLIDLCY